MFRNELLAVQLKSEFDFVVTGLFCHHDDKETVKAGYDFQKKIGNGINDFVVITYADYFECIQKLDLAWEQRELVMTLWARYCGLQLSENVINQNVIDQILPVYGDKDCMLVIHTDDYHGKQIDDTLCIKLIPPDKEIGIPWSMAKMLKFFAYEPIYGEDEIIRAKRTLTKKYSKKQLSCILFNLENPRLSLPLER